MHQNVLPILCKLVYILLYLIVEEFLSGTDNSVNYSGEKNKSFETLEQRSENPLIYTKGKKCHKVNQI